MTEPHPQPFASLPHAPPLPPEPPAPRPRGTSGLAIAAAIFGVLGGLLGIILGIIALVRIRRTGQAGKGLAITGIVASCGWLALFGLVAVAALTTGAERDASGAITEAGRVPMDELRPGDCVNEVTVAGLSLPAVPCSEPHEGEVYAVFDVALEGAWPGQAAIIAEAETCVERLASGFPAAYEDNQVEIYHLAPSEDTWRQGDRKVVCIARYRDGPRTGSLFG